MGSKGTGSGGLGDMMLMLMLCLVVVVVVVIVASEVSVFIEGCNDVAIFGDQDCDATGSRLCRLVIIAKVPTAARTVGPSGGGAFRGFDDGCVCMQRSRSQQDG